MSKHKLDWDKLRVFGVVAELESMTAAARQLGESTPTVSRKIDELERVLNCQLLVRSTKGVEVTEVGRQILRRIHVIGDQADFILEDVSDLDQEAAGDLRIGSMDGVLSHWMTQFLPQYLEDNKQLQLHVSISEDSPDLLKNEADLSFVFTKPQHRDLLSVRMGVLHYMFFASQSYLDEYGHPESLFDMEGHRFLLHEAYVHQIDNWSSRATDLKRMLTYAVTTNSGTVLKELCANGGGLTLMPSYAAAIDERLVALDLPELVQIEFWLAYTQRVQHLSRGRKFIDWIRMQFRHEDNPWFRETFVHPKNWDEQTRQRLNPVRLAISNSRR